MLSSAFDHVDDNDDDDGSSFLSLSQQTADASIGKVIITSLNLNH